MSSRSASITIAQVKTLVAEGHGFSVRYIPSGTKGAKPAFYCIYKIDGASKVLHSTAAGQPSQPKLMAVWPGVIRHHMRYGGGAILELDLKNAND